MGRKVGKGIERRVGDRKEGGGAEADLGRPRGGRGHGMDRNRIKVSKHKTDVTA